MGKPKLGQTPIGPRSPKPVLVPQFCCGVEGCRKYFSKFSQLKYHQNTHLKEKPYKCDYEGCTSSYYRPNHLQRHIQTIHEASSEKVGDFKCPEEGCEASFATKSSLYFHTKRKHFTLPHQCTFCEKKFGKKWTLKEHEASHTGASPFKCEVEACEEEFKEYKQFKTHKRQHEKKTCVVKKDLICPVKECQQSFLKWSELVSHKKASHPKESECPTCHKTFTKSNLKVHMKVHIDNSEKEALMCPIEGCPRYYFHQKNLNHHLRVKHHDQGFQCSICQRKLSSKQKLDKHIKVIHQGEGKTGKKKKKVKKSTSILKKLTTMTDADWEVPKPGPPRYIGEMYKCLKFPDESKSAEHNGDNEIDLSNVKLLTACARTKLPLVPLVDREKLTF